MGVPFGKIDMKWVVVVWDSGRNDNQQSLRGKAGADNSQPDRQRLAAEVLGGGSQAGVDHMKQENWIEKDWSCPRFVTWFQGVADKDLGDTPQCPRK